MSSYSPAIRLAHIGCLVVLCLSVARAQTSHSITMTIKGNVISGTDGNPSSNPPFAGQIFGVGHDLAGEPFTLTIQISDMDGMPATPDKCPDGSISQSAITGKSTSSAPKARLEIGTKGGSFTFGSLPLYTIGWTMIRTGKTTCSTSNTITIGWSETEYSIANDITGHSGFGSVVLDTQNDLPIGDWYTPVPLQGVKSQALNFSIVINQETNIYNNLDYASGYLNPTSIEIVGETSLTSPQPKIIRALPDGTTVDVTNTPQPVAVVVGEQIVLKASLPSGAVLSGAPWSLTGTVVGGYVFTYAPAKTPISAKVLNVNLTKDTTTFYWIVPGSFTVTLSCTLANGQSATVDAFFEVSGPTAPYVMAQMVPMPHIGYDSCDQGFLTLSDPSSNPKLEGITFMAGANVPSDISGKFKWAQLIDDSEATKAGPPGTLPSTSVTAAGGELDNGFPYVRPNAPSDMVTFDSPNWPLPSRPYVHLEFRFSARMYLMWQSATPPICDPQGLCNFIPVPLGYMAWAFTATADWVLPTWQVSGSDDHGDFQARAAYPTWSHVARNTPHCVVATSGARTGVVLGQMGGELEK